LWLAQIMVCFFLPPTHLMHLHSTLITCLNWWNWIVTNEACNKSNRCCLLPSVDHNYWTNYVCKVNSNALVVAWRVIEWNQFVLMITLFLLSLHVQICRFPQFHTKVVYTSLNALDVHASESGNLNHWSKTLTIDYLWLHCFKSSQKNKISLSLNKVTTPIHLGVSFSLFRGYDSYNFYGNWTYMKRLRTIFPHFSPFFQPPELDPHDKKKRAINLILSNYSILNLFFL